jgi:heat-inducible transcriptional repressor
MIRHLFHQVEGRLDEWLSLAASVVARLSQNTAVITVPKPADCQFRRMELVSIQENLVLLVLVLRGLRIKQQLLNLESPVLQPELNAISEKMNHLYASLSSSQIKAKEVQLNPLETQMRDNLIKMMDGEDEMGFNQSYLEGLHFMLNQPEFSHNQRIMAILDLLEHRAMLGSILPVEQSSEQVKVVIGTENQAEVAHECSLVISRYGLPNEAIGSILVVGPTRMPYPKVISAVSYLSALLSGLVGELYGVNPLPKLDRESKN